MLRSTSAGLSLVGKLLDSKSVTVSPVSVLPKAQSAKHASCSLDDIHGCASVVDSVTPPSAASPEEFYLIPVPSQFFFWHKSALFQAPLCIF